MKLHELIERASKGEFTAGYCQGDQRYVVTGRDMFIADIVNGCSDDQSVEKANAQLISHALNNFMPMLEALERVTDEYKEAREVADMLQNTVGLDIAKEAIKNAKEVA